jgi:hypothetical protein
MKNLDYQKVEQKIITWLSDYAKNAFLATFCIPSSDTY